MSTKTVSFTQKGIAKLPNDRPVIYKILTEGGKNNYTGIAKKGRVRDRLLEHLEEGDLPGVKVQIKQVSSITEAKKTEHRIIARIEPKYNETGT